MQPWSGDFGLSSTTRKLLGKPMAEPQSHSAEKVASVSVAVHLVVQKVSSEIFHDPHVGVDTSVVNT